jgi:CheY-like chemotaxis protein
MRPKKTVLVVDEDEKELSLRRFLLETRGYCVVSATSGREALGLIQTMLPGTLDLLLCDLMVPDMEANEIVRRAKKLYPDLRTMITSRTVQSSDRALLAEVFLPKAANLPAEVLERVRTLVARKRGPKKKDTPRPVEQPCQHARAFEARERAA